MNAKSSQNAWPNILGQANTFLAFAAGALLIFMMALVSSAVLMRYMANKPILGVNEIVQLLAVAITMLALPYATQKQAHVRADILDPSLGRVGRFIGDILSRCLSIFVMAVLVGRAWDKMWDALKYKDATNMLNLPIWPVYGLIALGIGLSMVVFAVEIVVLIRSGHAMGDNPND